MNRLIFLILGVVLGLATLSLVTFVGLKPGPESTFYLKSDQDTIIFGVTPWGESTQTKEAYKPLLDYLGEKTGKKFQLLVIENYDTAIDNIAEGNIDVATIPPVSFVLAKKKEPGIQYISTLMREEGGKRFATYRGYIVALASKYAGWTLDDFLKEPGKYVFGFVTKSSSSGWAYPTALFKKRGIEPEKAFKRVIVFENHPGVTDAIVDGQVDLGATWEYNMEKARQKHGDLFTIVHTIPDIPGLVWVASKKVAPSFVGEIRKIQLELSGDEALRQKVLHSTPDKGWQVLDERVYESVREVLRYVGTFQ